MPSSRRAALLVALSVLVLAYIALQLPLHLEMAAPLLSPLARLLPRGANSSTSGLFKSASTSRLPSATRSPSHPLNTVRPFTCTIPTANMTHDKMSFKDAVKHRRTVYQLNKKSPADDKKIEEIARIAIKDVPSSFNSQSTRLVILLKDEHDKFWDIVKDILKVHVPEDKWEHTGQRIQGFRNAYGTVSSSTNTSTRRMNTVH